RAAGTRRSWRATARSCSSTRSTTSMASWQSIDPTASIPSVCAKNGTAFTRIWVATDRPSRARRVSPLQSPGCFKSGSIHSMTTVLPASPPALPACDYHPRPYAGPTRDEVLALRRRYAHPSLFAFYREPLLLVEGHMQYIFDETGRRYLDLFAGI